LAALLQPTQSARTVSVTDENTRLAISLLGDSWMLLLELVLEESATLVGLPPRRDDDDDDDDSIGVVTVDAVLVLVVVTNKTKRRMKLEAEVIILVEFIIVVYVLKLS